MMGIPGMRGATLAPVARLDVDLLRFLCWLAREVPGSEVGVLFSSSGGTVIPAVRGRLLNRLVPRP